MDEDIEKLVTDVTELEAMRDSALSMSDHEKIRFNQMIKDVKSQNKSLRRELEQHDKAIILLTLGTKAEPDPAEGVQENI